MLKGVDGLLEVIGGTLLLVFGTARINHLIRTLTQNDLDHPPHTFVSHLLSAHLHVIEPGSVHFAAFYLLFQGVIKIWLAEALLRERRWVFPVALVLMGLFDIYLLYRIVTHPSIGFAALFAINLIIMVLIWREYGTLRAPDHRFVSRTPAR